MKKAYNKPVCEEINVRLIGSVLDQGEVGGWSYVAAGDDDGYADTNTYSFDDEEGNDNSGEDWGRVGMLWDN